MCVLVWAVQVCEWDCVKVLGNWVHENGLKDGGIGRGGGRRGKGGGGRREEERGWKLEFRDYCLSIHLSIATIKVIFFTEQLYSFLYTTFYTF